jgi:hypothetical protein
MMAQIKITGKVNLGLWKADIEVAWVTYSE